MPGNHTRHAEPTEQPHWMSLALVVLMTGLLVVMIAGPKKRPQPDSDMRPSANPVSDSYRAGQFGANGGDTNVQTYRF